jgi:hypothetical protein
MNKKASVPPEPTEIKNAMKALIGRITGEAGKWQSLVAWYGNRLPQYLWTSLGWKRELTQGGWRWQDFLSLLSRHTKDIVCWANDEMPWSKLVESIETDLDNSAGTMLRITKPRNTKINEY